MGQEAVLLLPPGLDFLPCILQRQESFRVQALIPEATAEELNNIFIRGVAAPGEVQRHFFIYSPVQRLGDEPAPVVHLYTFGQCFGTLPNSFQNGYNIFLSHTNAGALMAVFIDYN